ncbi:hypothetical protein [Catenulispora subtropica]|uniref:hypothetical protein n=1 Tax=Catenulispora subtropica TaxID=450798 RepID=UPI0031DB7D75
MTALSRLGRQARGPRGARRLRRTLLEEHALSPDARCATWRRRSCRSPAPRSANVYSPDAPDSYPSSTDAAGTSFDEIG